ncbi:RNI-like protein [Pholiota conissans]|uniref:RNI-like protein n=1 Tax=Pholiota conissans TaxID=109636 RepID=A0A9P5Z7D8_9AGAR|nr:RNI-like protein [Pholiota conissans]
MHPRVKVCRPSSSTSAPFVTFPSFMPDSNPSVGARINHNGDIATIRYVGPVDGTRGTWLGVEWDITARGKHDGCKDGKQYFICRSKASGSFIRPTPHILYGVSFLHALSAKYIETLHGSQTQEKVTLGSSQGAIQVEAVSLDKIREKFARLDRLREVSLENANVVKGDPSGSIVNTCPNIRGLDLSQNLFTHWETIAQITQELPALQRLSLNRNRLQLSTNPDALANAFLRLTEIQLNATLMTWAEMQKITAFMPQLQAVEMGYNQLTRLRGDNLPTSFNSTISTINLDSNLCSDWIHLWSALKEYQCLQRVILTANSIKTIPFPQSPSDFLPGIKYLSLSDNNICNWDVIDSLSCWLPSLETLTIGGNPLVNVAGPENQTRPLLIARIPSLCTLDGTIISSRERMDAELFYMSVIMNEGIVSDDERAKAHHHWHNLCKKHGKPDEVREQQKPQTKLGNQLLDLKLYAYNEEFVEKRAEPSEPPTAVIRVLPSMTLRILRLKICKALKYDPRNTNIMFWLRMPHGALGRLDDESTYRDLDWLGLEHNSQIIYQIQ